VDATSRVTAQIRRGVDLSRMANLWARRDLRPTIERAGAHRYRFLPLYARHRFCSSHRLVTREGSRGIWLATMMGGFAVLWVFWGTLSLPDLPEICVVAGALVISVVVGLVAFRWARSIPVQDVEQPPNWKIFWGWVIFEIVAGAVGINILYQLGQGRFALPWFALVVGIHFFGMGAAFHASIHRWIGAAMCLLALISLIWLPSCQTPSAGVVKVSDVVVGIGCAVILWSFVLVSARSGAGR
jgi:hypothetical protein